MNYLNHSTVDVRTAYVEWDTAGNGIVTRFDLLQRPSFRAARLVDDSKRFLFLNFPRRAYKSQLLKFLRNADLDGISHEGTRFAFLGMTEPGIKDGQVIFFQEDSRMSVKKLLNILGNLENVFINSGPGKYAARLGLSFSSTTVTIDAPNDRVMKIPDRHAEDGTCTTDGCCIIRESEAAKIRNILRVHPQTAVFQFRRGGQKGLLVAYPDEDFDKICVRANPRARHVKYIYAYRPSMHKYDGGPTMIEINKVSGPPRSARLNLSFIILLLTLGTKLEPLQVLLREQIQKIEEIMTDRHKALEHVKRTVNAQHTGYLQDLFELLIAGHDITEPHLSEMLRGQRNILLSNLRNSFAIDIKKSCYLYGVVDELGVLKDGEVFFKLSHRETITGSILVARNPSYLPTDLQILKAVDYSDKLGFLTNCIVFPRNGKTSIADLMSGGDLDGDSYFVCWDHSIIPHSSQLSRGRTPPLQVKHEQHNLFDLNRSLIETFATLRNSRLLSATYAEWKRVVDKSTDLANASYPRKLAETLIVVLDLAKTGADHELLYRRFEDLQLQYSEHVDMLYPSPLDRLQSQIPNREGSVGPKQFHVDPDLILKDGHESEWDMYVEEGLRLIGIYNRRMSSILSSDESPSGNFQGRSSIDELKKEFTDKYFPPFTGSINSQNIIYFIRASAWYFISYRRNKTAFAWLGAKYLNHIKAAVTRQRQMEAQGRTARPRRGQALNRYH